MPRFTGANMRHNQRAVARFAMLAAAQGLSPAQLWLGWIWSRGTQVVALPGTGSAIDLVDDLGVATAAGTIAGGEAIFAGGARYPAAMRCQIDT